MLCVCVWRVVSVLTCDLRSALSFILAICVAAVSSQGGAVFHALLAFCEVWRPASTILAQNFHGREA